MIQLVMRRRLSVSAAALAWRLLNLGYIDETERDWVLSEGSQQLREVERALYGEVDEPAPIPTLTDRARGLALEAYLKDELTASTAAEFLEQTLTTVQEYLIALRIPVSRVSAYQVQSHCYAAVE